MRVRVELAGQLAVVHDGAALRPVGRLGRVVLAYLVTERHRPVHRDELAEILWGEQVPRTWETSLRVVVSKLRAALGEIGLPAGVLATGRGGYRVELPPGAVLAVDVEEAVEAVAAAEALLAGGRPEEARPLAAAAAAVAGRPFLGGDGGEWGERREGELRALRLRALLAVADAALAAGDPGGALTAAEAAVAAEPFREAAHERVMAAHGAAGNRAEALRAYERCRRLLAEEIGVPPSRAVQALHERQLLDDVHTARRPPTTTFVGRQREVAEVRALLGRARLLTLLGTGGIGKTRLALEAAVTPATGTVVIELAAAPGPGSVALQVLAALGLREGPGLDPVASLVAQLADRALLVMLDSCEHVIEQSAGVSAALLRGCPGVRILATSREPLRVAGELTWAVPPLDLSEAAALFADRARAARPDRELDRAAVEQVCRRLDGIPLAIELAAARTRALSVADIARHLDDRFRLLTGGGRDLPARHQTLRAAVDWTYEALPREEAALFDRLSVFAGGFPAEAAEQVCAGGEVEGASVMVLVASLVDRSLVLADVAPAVLARFRLLETLREYGAERLSASGEGPAVRDRHLAWAMELAAQAHRRLGGPEQGSGLEVLAAAHDDLRAALAWAGQVSPEAGLRLATDLGRFWEIRGHLSTGRRALESALAAVAPVPTSVRARALDWAGILAQQQGDYAEGAEHFRASLAVHRHLGHDRGVAAGLHGLGNLAALRGDLAEASQLYGESLALGRRTDDHEVQAAALANLGSVAENQGDLSAAEALFEQSLAIRRRLGDDHAIALLTGNLGHVAFQGGDLARARRLLDDSLALRRRLGDRAGAANALANLGSVALSEGDLAQARARLEASLALAAEVGDRRAATVAHLRLARVARAAGDVAAAVELDRRAVPPAGHGLGKRTIAEWLEGLAATSSALGRDERAATLLGAAAATRDAIGAPVPAPERAAVAGLAETVRARLGDDGYAGAEAAGRRLDVAAAVDFAWRDMPVVPTAGPTGVDAPPSR